MIVNYGKNYISFDIDYNTNDINLHRNYDISIISIVYNYNFFAKINKKFETVILILTINHSNMQKLDLKPGVKVRGWGYLNEYGEMHFQPEKKGSRPSSKKLLFESPTGYALRENKKEYIVELRLPKKTVRNFSYLTSLFTSALYKLLTYAEN